MNTEEEIKQAYDDYRSTRFGGWPFNEGDPVNAKNSGRFTKYNDRHIEER